MRLRKSLQANAFHLLLALAEATTVVQEGWETMLLFALAANRNASISEKNVLRTRRGQFGSLYGFWSGSSSSSPPDILITLNIKMGSEMSAPISEQNQPFRSDAAKA